MSMSLQERDYVRNAKFSIRYSTLFSAFIVHDTPVKASPASNKMPPQESHLPTLLGDVFCVFLCSTDVCTFLGVEAAEVNGIVSARK